MTRFARMPKKKYLEASSWDELSRQQKVKQEETANDEKQNPNEDSKPESKIRKQKKPKKRNLEYEDSISSEPVSSPKQQKIADPNTSEPKTERRKDKKKEIFQPKDKKRLISKDTLQVDSTKAGEGQGMEVKFVSSRKAEKLVHILVKQEETANDEKQKPTGDSKPKSKRRKKKKSKKRNLEDDQDSISSEPVSISPEKQKITDSNISEAKIERKKDKNQEMLQPKDKKRLISKDTFQVDSTKAGEGQGMEVKFFSSRKAEKIEKQKEARRRRRAKRKGITCFRCRQLGHQAAQCPQIQEGTGIGVCYKCGSSDHTTRNCKQKGTEKGGNPFPFAKCFICGDVGHLSSGCPDNPKGLYPKGGGCNICGSVEHLKRDCPEAIPSKKKDGNIKVKSASHSFKSSKLTSADAEVYSDDEEPHLPKHYYKKNKTVKF